MLSLKLSSLEEYRWIREEDNPAPKTFPHGLLYHQWRTYQAEEPLIVNTSPTGTGKTKAALLRLLKRARRKSKLSALRDNVLLIAPTNELLQQHVEDARRFCQDNDLPYHVNPLSKSALDGFIETYRLQHPGLPSERRGADLVTFLRNSSAIEQDYSKQAALWVVNPDIFHYAVTFSYCDNDRGPVFEAFFNLFNYLIIDELHYYDAKQLATFLFFMKLSQYYGFIDNTLQRRQFCILTATPRTGVKQYLMRLGEPIAWIESGIIAPEDQAFVETTRVLAPAHLYIYTTEELQEQELGGGLLQLITQERETIRRWLDPSEKGKQSKGEEPMEGAIISSSLGVINRIHQRLCERIDQEKIGRITGAEQHTGRDEAREKPLILATPTVDIGYNFERLQPKRRQNIDFLFFDATFSDEVLQRLGRAGRVLGKQCQDQESIVYALVDPTYREHLKQFDGTEVARTAFNTVLEQLPGKNDLFAYLRSGAIADIYRPVVLLQQGMSDEGQRMFLAFLIELQQLLAPDKKIPQDLSKFQACIRGIVYGYEERRKHYQRLQTFPSQAFRKLRSVIEQKMTLEQIKTRYPEFQATLEVYRSRLMEKRQQFVGRKIDDVIDWVYCDLRQYTIERARLSFRESFQPPQALVYDPDELHSGEAVATYSAFHFVRNYELAYYSSLKDWRQQDVNLGKYENTNENVAAYFRLLRLRDEPLQLTLTLDVRPQRQADWEQAFAYQITALYGLRIVVNDHTGLPLDVQSLFQEQFIPAFVARKDSNSSYKMRELQKQARFYPMQLRVTFNGAEEWEYLAVLGTMAFHIHAELPRWTLARDLGKALLEDDSPIIC